jgi:hypothetical protein
MPVPLASLTLLLPLGLLATGASARGIPERWLEGTPLAGFDPPRLFTVPAARAAVELADGLFGAVMLCFGAPGMATRCERQVLPERAALPAPELAAGVQVVGRVLVGRSPARGARVAVVPHPLLARRLFSVPLARRGAKLSRDVAADGRGRFLLPLAPGTYRLDLRLPGGRIEQSEPFTVPEPERLRREDAPAMEPTLDLGDLVFDEGLRLEVTVVDSQGQPIAGAGVGLLQEREPDFPVFFEEWADRQGKATFSGIDATLPARLNCIAPGRVRSTQPLDPLPPAATCVLARLAAVEGVILDEEAKPIAGATISAQPADQSARTGEDGRFGFEELEPGEHSFTVAAPGFRALVRTVVLANEEQRELAPIHLDRAGLLEGAVVDGASGEPISGALIAVLEPQGAGSTTTGEDGSFRLAAEAEGPLRLETQAEGYPLVVTEVSRERQALGEPLTIELPRGGQVHLTVWDEELDAPCAGCSVLIVPVGRGGALLTGTSGEALSPLLAPGRYYATLSRTQSLGSVVRVRGGDDRRHFEIQPGRVARVAFGERRPLVEIVFWPSPPPPGWSLAATAGPAARLLAPRPDGTYAVPKRGGEEVALDLQAPSGTRIHQAVLPHDLEDPVVRLDLPQTRVQGLVVEDENPLAGEPVQLVSAQSGAVAARARTGGDGRFEVPYLAPGVYHVAVGVHVLRSFELGAGAAVDLGTLAAPTRRPKPASR